MSSTVAKAKRLATASSGSLLPALNSSEDSLASEFEDGQMARSLVAVRFFSLDGGGVVPWNDVEGSIAISSASVVAAGEVPNRIVVEKLSRFLFPGQCGYLTLFHFTTEKWRSSSSSHGDYRYKG